MDACCEGRPINLYFLREKFRFFFKSYSAYQSLFGKKGRCIGFLVYVDGFSAYKSIWNEKARLLMDNKLEDMVTYAYENINFYKQVLQGNQLLLSDMQAMPIASEEEIQQQVDTMVAQKYLKYPYSSRIQIRNCVTESGVYLKTYWYEEDIAQADQTIWKWRQTFGITAQDRCCDFFITKYVTNTLLRPIKEHQNQSCLGINKDVLTSTEAVRNVYERIKLFAPKWIQMEEDVAKIFVEFWKKESPQRIVGIQYIELLNCWNDHQIVGDLETIFGCVVRRHYWRSEFGSIAYECGHHHLHICGDNVSVEVISQGKSVDYGERGKLCITSLTNRVMPLIRYQTGIESTLYTADDCTCVTEDPILEINSQQMDLYIETENGGKISSSIFLKPIENINERIGNIIKQFYILQDGVNQFAVNMLIDSSYRGWKDEIEKLFIEHLQQPELADAVFEFMFTDNHMERVTGYFENRMNKMESD